ncbi:hypothetical protein DYBT9623_04418 [Dyadobacter sp. CECT 9623]|uniref:Uncharacterized protein n=1 Tax=Dyadobacter linearis TaxID=2823330 RepID=A0ABM8UVX9_9BACT|nr:hypothetical protein [Dyadobacter sp. CECT 9623]CAG5072878.1 hypothetical protein DYBT9623_04418 [Dyadobacter sp. CECT 9623]
MALPKAKVKERLEIKFPGVNLSTKRIDATAAKLKLPDDSDDDAIDEKLDELNDIFPFADIARHDDRQREIEAKKKKDKQPDSPDPKQSEEDPKPDPQSTDIAKIVAAAIAPLVEKINSFETGKIGDSRKSQLEELLKDTNPKYKESVLKHFGRMKFETDEDFEAFKTEAAEDAKEFIQIEANEGLGGFKTPVQGKGGQKKQVSTEEADAILDKVL